MSKTSKEIINGIKDKDYDKKPLNVQEMSAKFGVPQVVNDLKEIPKTERSAMGRDMHDTDSWFVNDPEGRLRELTKKDLLYLMHSFLGFKDVSPRVEYHKDLAGFYDRDFLRMIVLLPRWHFKSTFGASYIVRDLIRNPNNTWLITSATDGLAKTIYELVQTSLLTESMQLIWGDMKVNKTKPKWGGTELNIALRNDFTTREPSVYWQGINSEVTGQHPTNGLFDDISAETNCETPEQRKKIKDRYDRKILIVQKIILNNATRWHFDDVIGYLLDKNKQKDDNDPFRYRLFKRNVYDDYGQPLFHEKYPRSWIESMRKELGAYLFATQMMNNPIPEEEQKFRPEWITANMYGSLGDIEEKFKDMNFYITVDPASSDTKSGDNTGIIVCGVTPDYNIYVVEDATGRMHTNDAIRKIFDLVAKWKEKGRNIPLVGIEQGHYYHEYRKPLKDLMKIKGTVFSRRALKYGGQPGTRSRAKKDRIMTLQPYFENGMVHIGKWMEKLEDEIVFYGAHAHDDRVDALAYQLQLIKVPREAKQTEQKTRVEKWLDRKRRGRGYGSLRSYINSDALTTR